MNSPQVGSIVHLERAVYPRIIFKKLLVLVGAWCRRRQRTGVIEHAALSQRRLLNLRMIWGL